MLLKLTTPWPPPLPPAAPVAGSAQFPPCHLRRKCRGSTPPLLPRPNNRQPPPDRLPSDQCSTGQPVVGEWDGPDCGWCCWVSLAKSGRHCATTRNRRRTLWSGVWWDRAQICHLILEINSGLSSWTHCHIRSDATWSNITIPGCNDSQKPYSVHWLIFHFLCR